jgi:hypothetical protein
MGIDNSNARTGDFAPFITLSPEWTGGRGKSAFGRLSIALHEATAQLHHVYLGLPANRTVRAFPGLRCVQHDVLA